MTREALRMAALLLDRASAETRELRWIAPLACLKEQALTLALEGEAQPFDGEAAKALLSRCEALARDVAEGKPLAPDAPRKLLFNIFEASSPSVNVRDAEGLRAACARHADFIRAAREARAVLRRAWRDCPGDVRREEEAAFDAQTLALEQTFEHLLGTCEAAICMDDVRRRARQVRSAQRAMDGLRVPPDPAALYAEEAFMKNGEVNFSTARIIGENSRLTGQQTLNEEEIADVSGGFFQAASGQGPAAGDRREHTVPAEHAPGRRRSEKDTGAD